MQRDMGNPISWRQLGKALILSEPIAWSLMCIERTSPEHLWIAQRRWDFVTQADHRRD
ncbi:hypothetical protein M378DRAFT_906029 [Amanita muscaria Koide BX008]|uniref:Uncharacterized protein n=1 Tax=Amanita muscaria (strain Koide BX008) TaxID=946122 RepID=A0A0C2WGY9_AMAMK|nr:hypothetical protein M378DRAFT_906029 [Amanita muscaria Koide BX008]